MQIPFFSKQKSAVHKVKEVGSTSLLSLVNSYQSYTLGLQRRTYLNEYKDWVYSCISSRAQDVSNAEFFATNEKGERLDDNKSELMKLLRTVNTNMTMRELIFGTITHKDADGNAFWFLARDKDGKGAIREIYLLRPDRIEIATDKNKPLEVSGYVYKTERGGKITFEPNQVLHFRNFNPSGDHPFPHKGKSIIEAGLSAIETDNQARKWNFNFFKNSARPDGLISKKEGVIGDDEYRRIKSELETAYQGTENSHKTMILTGGLEFKEITRLQKDMEFIEQRRFSRDEILSTFKVPKTVLGIVEDVNRANAEASDYVFASRTVRPLIQDFVDTINEYIASEFKEKLNFVSPVPEDKVAKIAEYEKGVNKWLTVNEIRAREGLPPVDGGDAILDPISAQVMPVKSVVVPTIEEKMAQADEIEIDSEVLADFKGVLPTETDIEIIDEEDEAEIESKAVITEEQRKNFIDGWINIFDINEKPFKTKLAQYFAEQEKEVLSNLANSVKGLEPAEYRYKAFEEVLFDEDYQIELGIKLITPRIEKYIEQSSKNAVARLGVGSVLDLASPKVQEFITKRSQYFAESVNKTTVDKILTTLNEGADAQENLTDLTKRVQEIFTEAKTSRAEMIARTEVSASGNFGSTETYKEAGVEMVEWYNPDPEHEACVENAGKKRKIGDEFPSGDTTPPAHPNCRSILIPIFD